MSAEDATSLTSSDQSSGEEFSETDMEGTSDYGSKYVVLFDLSIFTFTWKEWQ